MAKRHFDERGHPDLDLISEEIHDYFGNLSERYTAIARDILIAHNFGRNFNVMAPKQEDYLAMMLAADMKAMPDKPAKVNEIYVIGGQVPFLPDSYNAGDHDLDLRVETNLEQLYPGTNLASLPLEVLHYFMNDRTDGKSREFQIDISHEPIYGPRLQIG
ncbi:hypothetical protein HQ545_06150 [Candidatus Woesearchaeota archaeon]|nr:hypothetical protein [Candidatus Woesearchaeota archaeon]